MNKKTSLADVAAIAGVSVATVSRVLNNPKIVKADLRERVLKASRDLGYVPHGAARALASNRTRSIGVVVPTLGISVFARGVEALQDRLGEDGYRLLVANSQYDLAKEFQETQSLLAHGVDGLILVGNERLPETRKLLRKYACPVVVTFVHEAAEDYPAVGFNNFSSSYDMTSYLIGLGHRHFSVLTSPAGNNDRIRGRCDGVLRCLEDSGPETTLEHLLEVPYMMEAGREGLREIVERAPRTTCLICTTDVIAVGAMAEARQLGIAVPDDLSIAGYDGLDFASYLTPALTTVTVPAPEIGARAAERMLDILAGRPSQPTTVIDAALTVRGSTAAPRPAERPLLKRAAHDAAVTPDD
ncbi:LacI family DNA-binding transcriptional regulator [Rhizobiaceae bacterium BDR2-2]|uniref:LacI family DNA-binding transcriptional regulator n=1 Tax=Ectorhizobium quercum TaxID=2965071 RepID=A0AAE3N1I2_9HYPH|nr:LacI family DNA-binding transcriptional regulator [Ectorhizobium quercum]MCX8997022.1 LacI family DNA-binding transcriptional regulator [Ectorhizobium quercum]